MRRCTFMAGQDAHSRGRHPATRSASALNIFLVLSMDEQGSDPDVFYWCRSTVASAARACLRSDCPWRAKIGSIAGTFHPVEASNGV